MEQLAIRRQHLPFETELVVQDRSAITGICLAGLEVTRDTGDIPKGLCSRPDSLDTDKLFAPGNLCQDR